MTYFAKSLNAQIRYDQRSELERERFRDRLFAKFARLKQRRAAKQAIPLPWVRR